MTWTRPIELRSKGFMTAVEFKRRQVLVLEQKQAISALNQQLAARQNQLTETQLCAPAVADRDGAKGARAPQRPRRLQSSASPRSTAAAPT